MLAKYINEDRKEFGLVNGKIYDILRYEAPKHKTTIFIIGWPDNRTSCSCITYDSSDKVERDWMIFG